ncbi:hypothetical protein EG329_012106 [Mollisiaceae sp. DMI_Dod_QoI]|nr:hypothetical protein EG329_012106 [Helotiales sp. DMI_Dod_QoI]
MPFNGLEFREAAPYEYEHSIPIDPALYENEDYLFNVRPRINKWAEAADRAGLELRDDWKAASGSEYKKIASINPIAGNASALFFPEATEERLFTLSYMTEYTAIYDDMVDAMEKPGMLGKGENTHLAWVDYEKQTVVKHSKDMRHRLIKAIQARVMAQILEQDEVAGKTIAKELKALIEAQGITRDLKPKNLDEYLEFRLEDFGKGIVSVSIGFGVTPTITLAEIESVSKITKQGTVCMILCNDYWSWDKEVVEYEGTGGFPLNAVHILMEMNKVDAKAAKELVKGELAQRIQDYGDSVTSMIEALPLDSPIVRYLGLLDLTIAGNAVWSLSCPRYKLIQQPQPSKLDKDKDQETNISSPMIKEQETKTSTSADTVGFGQKSRASLSSISEKIILEPYHYVSSLPAGGLRNALIDALGSWYSVPDTQLSIIGDIITISHNVSLMLDDIQDGTLERRGSPAAHVVFGTSQTINSATYMIFVCFEKVRSLDNKECLDVFIEEMKITHMGQGLDLYWTHHCKSPTEEAYLSQAEQKTGGLLRLLAKMMHACSKNLPTTILTPSNPALATRLMSLLGRYYQVHDDYRDLIAAKQTESQQRTDPSDLDQGNFTLPLLHLLSVQETQNETQLLNMLQARKENKGMSAAMKSHLLQLLDKAGSLEYTKAALRDLQEEIMTELEEVERLFGRKNWILRLLLMRLKI